MAEPSKEPRLDLVQRLQPSAPDVRVLKAEELFRGRCEICIDHDGVCYRLRITRRNRLILQK